MNIIFPTLSIDSQLDFDVDIDAAFLTRENALISTILFLLQVDV